MDKKYAIFPREIEDGTGIIDKFYRQMCLLNLLQGKNSLIPEVKYQAVTISDFKPDRFRIVPHNLSEEDITLLYLYEEDEAEKFISGIRNLLTDKRYEREKQELSSIYSYLGFFYNKFTDYHSESLQIVLPVPVFLEKGLFKYGEITDKLAGNEKWIEQLINFFDFLTGELLLIEGLKPDDFLYDNQGNIRYFLAYNQLALKSDRQDLLEKNLNSLAYLLYSYYIEDIARHRANLYSQQHFEKLEGRLIEPLVYGSSAHKLYNNFQEIKNDLQGKSVYSFSEKSIGVFLDTANIFKVMEYGTGKMRVDFDKLLTEIYGRIESRKIKKKIAVIFLPTYEDDEKNNELLEIMFDIRNYLEDYDFEVVEVENNRKRPKEIIDGREVDIDDQRLIEIMINSLGELDSMLLLTGDRHFYDITSKYQESGKEVKVISLTEKSTYQGFVDKFDHEFIYNYWDCIEYQI